MNDDPAKGVSVSERVEQLTRELRDANFRFNQKIVQIGHLYEAGVRLSASLRSEDVVTGILPLAVATLDARCGFLLLRDESTGRLNLEQQINITDDQRKLLKEKSLRTRLRRAMRAGGPISLDRTELPPGLESEHLLVAGMGDEGVICVIDKETLNGFVAFEEEDGRLLELMAQQARTAIANARHHRHMVDERNLNQSIVSSIADGLISTDLQGLMVRANPKAHSIFSQDGGFRGRSCVRFFQRHGCKRIAEAVRTSLSDGEERTVEGERLEEWDLTLNAHITALRNEDSSVNGVLIALEDLTEQTRVRNIFKRYAGDTVVEHVLATDLQQALGGVERTATMLFVDLPGSTELLGDIGAVEMVELLNDCFTRLVDIVFSYDGILDKYTGDGFLAVFGAPVERPDDTERAVHTALAIRDEMKRFNRGKPFALGIKIGVGRGRVLAGNIGSRLRMEYSVIGHDVNVASRLCEHAKAGQILIGPTVHAESGENFEFEFIERTRFKGMTRPLDVHQVLGPKGTVRSQTEELPVDKSARVDLIIPMVSEMELVAVQAAAAVGEFAGFDKEKMEEVKVAMIESCINAFEHSKSKDGRLKIDFHIGSSDLTIAISDRGGGFDVSATEKKRKQKRGKDQRRGWGLTLIHELMDDVEIRSGQNGTTVTMVKRR
jgi:class 3 adenylate cyclase/anti-sigma regulatory factor (Ser/Thr protein kinase)